MTIDGEIIGDTCDSTFPNFSDFLKATIVSNYFCDKNQQFCLTIFITYADSFNRIEKAVISNTRAPI